MPGDAGPVVLRAVPQKRQRLATKYIALPFVAWMARGQGVSQVPSFSVVRRRGAG